MRRSSRSVLLLVALVMCSCAVDAGGPAASRDDLPCIPHETRCESTATMSVCAEDGLSRETVRCTDDEACVSALPGGRCEVIGSVGGTLRRNFDATLRVDLPSGGTCTGFLVTDDVLVTNEHCCADWSSCIERGVTAVARFRGEDGTLGQDRYSVREMVVASAALDVVALRVDGAPGETYGHVVLARGREHVGQGVYVLGHPDGRPLEGSLGVVYAHTESITFHYPDGVRTKEHVTVYGAEAEPGSSGSPVFLLGSHALVAVHHSGGLDPDALGLAPEAVDGFDQLLAGTDSEAVASLLEAYDVPVRSFERGP